MESLIPCSSQLRFGLDFPLRRLPLSLSAVQVLLLLHLLFIFSLARGLLREVSLCSAGCS